MSIEKLIEHWGIDRKDMLATVADIVKTARDEKRPNTSDRHQYDAWTRTLVAVVEEAAERAA